MLARLLTAEVFGLMLLFARLGSAFVLLPGFGENYVPTRVRLLLAGAVTILVAPLLASQLPAQPSNFGTMLLLLGGEIGIGLFIGTIARLMMTALEIAGTLIAFQIGLSTASIFNPLLSEQGSIISVLISITGMVVMFETDLHVLLLRGLVDSYTLFVPGQLPPIGDFTEMVSRVAARSFGLALQLSMPFIIVSVMLYVALGLASRLMPQLQVFFVALPLQIVLGFLVLILTFGTLLSWFMQNFADVIHTFLAPGT